MSRLMLRALSASLLAGALTISNAAFAQERENPLSAIGKLFGGDRQQQDAGEGAQPGRESPADQTVRIEKLEAMVRQLTGANEQLQYRNQQLEQQLRAMGGGQPQQAATQPMSSPSVSAQPQQPQRQLQSVPSQGLPPPSAGPAPAPAQQGGRRSDAFDPSLHPNAPGAPQTLGNPNSASRELPPAPVAANEPPVGVPDGRQAGAPLDLSTLATGIPAGSQPPSASVAGVPAEPLPQTGALPPPPPRNMSATGANANTRVASTAPPSETAQGYYDLAYGYVQRKDYAFAEDALQTFIKKYPNDARVPDAQFWLGESMFQRQRYDAAAEAFLAVSTKHGQHPKAPDALLRLGQSLAALNQKEMACATLAEVGRKYPKASNSIKQGVDREQKRVRC